MRRLALISGLIAMLAALSPALAGDHAEPTDIVWELRNRQDRIALARQGDIEMLREETLKAGRKLLAVDPEAWKDSRNVKAAVAYVLSGGNPRVLRTILNLGGLSEEDEALAHGALGYGEGDDEVASDYLGELNPRELEPGLASVVALVQAVLMVREEPKAALEKLSLARLLGTGTLIEEAALRRQALLALSTGDPAEFQRLALQYMRRFSQSIYADNFRRQFAAQLVRIPAMDKPEAQNELASNLSFMKAAHRLDFYLSLASEAIVRGKLDLALFAASQADQIASENASGSLRSHLYQGAALILTAKYEAGLTLLQSVDSGMLDGQDRELYVAAMKVAEDIRREEAVTYPVSEPPDPPPPPPLKVGQKPPKPPRLFDVPAPVTTARAKLAEIDKLLAGGLQ